MCIKISRKDRRGDCTMSQLMNTTNSLSNPLKCFPKNKSEQLQHSATHHFDSQLLRFSNSVKTSKYLIPPIKGEPVTFISKKVSEHDGTSIQIAFGEDFKNSASFVVESYSEPFQDPSSAYAKATSIQALKIPSLQVKATTIGTQKIHHIGGKKDTFYYLSVNGVPIFINEDVTQALTPTQIRDAINAVSIKTKVIASLNHSYLTLTAHDGRNIVLSESWQANTDKQRSLSAEGVFEKTLRGILIFTTSTPLLIKGPIESLGL